MPAPPEGDRLLLLDPHPTHIGATQSVAWCDVLDAQPTSEQWALVEAEACNRALRGQAPPLTLQQVGRIAIFGQRHPCPVPNSHPMA